MSQDDPRHTRDGDDYISSVTLIIIGDDLDPEQVTQLLQLAPNQSWKKGDKHVFKSGREHIFRWGGWKLFQGEKEDELCLEKQFESWMTMLSDKTVRIRQLTAMRYSVVFDCFLSTSDGVTVDLSPETIAWIASLGAGVTLNNYHYE